MGKVQIQVSVVDGKGTFGMHMDKANVHELALASAKMDILKEKLTKQIEKSLVEQSSGDFTKKDKQ